MKPYLLPVLLLFVLVFLVCLVVLGTKTACPTCGGPVYLFFLKFCPCK